MTTLTELKNSLIYGSFTTIQAKMVIEKYLGSEIEIDAIIDDIEDTKILLKSEISEGYGYYRPDYYNQIEFNEKFKDKLQTIRKGYLVKIIANLERLDFNSSFPTQSSNFFELISIEEKPILR